MRIRQHCPDHHNALADAKAEIVRLCLARGSVRRRFTEDGFAEEASEPALRDRLANWEHHMSDMAAAGVCTDSEHL